MACAGLCKMGSSYAQPRAASASGHAGGRTSGLLLTLSGHFYRGLASGIGRNITFAGQRRSESDKLDRTTNQIGIMRHPLCGLTALLP